MVIDIYKIPSILYSPMCSDTQRHTRETRKSIRILFFITGTLCVVIGTIGIGLPILPTTPFLLLAAVCYLRCSQGFHNWLINNKILGFYIRNYMEGKELPVRAKIVTISLLWVTILLSIFIIIQSLLVQILLIVIAITVSIHLILIQP
ncbi:MAG: hypothetical protein RBG13Loki_2601 [Promethearchaeota archaeon CR_4]|nr:MAG: hypothetical protein RBG13Loki_2601 [Candidatus Lokiarchaeota archaeon CR_4]